MNDLNSILHEGVLEKFLSYPENICAKLLFLRKLIFKVAQVVPEIGKIEESLRWGEPAYLTTQTKSGSTIRIDWKKSYPKQYCIYFNCNTSLVSAFKQLYGNLFRYNGNRSIIFFENDKIPINELSHCIEIAFTYNLKKTKN